MALDSTYFVFVLLIGSPDFEKSMSAHSAPLSPNVFVTNLYKSCYKFVRKIFLHLAVRMGPGPIVVGGRWHQKFCRAGKRCCILYLWSEDVLKNSSCDACDCSNIWENQLT